LFRLFIASGYRRGTGNLPGCVATESIGNDKEVVFPGFPCEERVFIFLPETTG
jgi:hypothetical protein